MATINEQFIQVKTKANFESRLSAGDIKDTSIAFIEDTNEIWAKGHYYSCPYSATEITNLLNNKVDKESGKSLVADELITKLTGLDDQDTIDAAINAVQGNLTTHINDKNNPHEVTKAQIGLSNVDNTSDVNKPISTATQTALNNKVDKTTTVNGHALSENVTVTKADVGLSNVDNTSDANKPVSTAQQAAIDAAEKVATDHIANKENPHEVTKEQIGLGNVTNDTQVKRTEMGVANGVATLNENGKIPTTLLNGLLASVQGVDQVATSTTLPETSSLALEYMVWCTDDKKFREWDGIKWKVVELKDDTIYNFRNSDSTGSTARTNILYRWDGQDLTEIPASVAIGETTGTAYDGAKGKANRDALNALPTTVVTGLGTVTPSADNVAIAFTDSDKNGGNNQYSNGDGGTITIPSATQSNAGLMSAADKSKVDGALQTANAGVGVLASYVIAAQKATIASTDTINQAIGKLEKGLNDLAGEVDNTGVGDYPVFSASTAYSAGDVVNYNGILYKFTADHAAGAWTGSDVEEITLLGIVNYSIWGDIINCGSFNFDRNYAPAQKLVTYIPKHSIVSIKGDFTSVTAYEQKDGNHIQLKMEILHQQMYDI